MKSAYRDTPVTVVDDTPCFIDDPGYCDNWSYQWQRWAKLHYSEEHRRKMYEYFIANFGLDPEDRNIPPMKILDAGCGSGAKLNLFVGSQHRLWGIDFSASVHFAKESLGKQPNMELAQGDIDNLPYKDDFFDYIYSSGVLIHVPDIERSIVSLRRTLRPGGTLAIAFARYYYPWEPYPFARELITSFYRLFTTRMKNEETLMKVVDTLSGLYRFESPFIRLFVPVLSDHDEWRRCYTFDFLTAKYRKRQRPGRIIKLLKKHGFTDIRSYPTHQVSLTAVKA